MRSGHSEYGRGCWRCVWIVLLLSVAACGTMRGNYNGPVQCAPYARQQSGIQLRGAANSWWAEARGRYRRVHKPRSGAVIVFRRTRYMPYGHVSVVRKVVSARRILVDQANWLSGRIEHDVPVVDVSGSHNWSRVRVWWAPTHSMGRRIYPVYGFILPS